MNQKRALTDGQLKKLAVAFSQNRIIDENLPLWRSRLNKKHKATLACRPQKKYEELRLDQLKLVSDWYHSAIICLLEIPAQEPVTETWIANRLKISTTEARCAINRLLRLGLLHIKDGRLLSTHANLATPSGIPSAALRQVNAQMIQQANIALEKQTQTDRDITSITMAIDKSKIATAKEMIRDFRRSLCAFLEEGVPTEVYAMNIQLFQLTK